MDYGEFSFPSIASLALLRLSFYQTVSQTNSCLFRIVFLFKLTAYDALLHHIFKVWIHFEDGDASLLNDVPQRTQGDAWFKPMEENLSAGVCLRVESGHFRVFPYENQYLAPFEAAVKSLNPVVAVKVRSASVHAALSTM
jgi:hypothetical protein